jgi:hypothetical protein
LRSPWLVAVWIGLATLLLYARPLLFPYLVQDDFQILSRGTTWQRTRASLWAPQNEHAMPPGRILTFLLVQAAGSAEHLPQLTTLVGPLSLLLSLLLLSEFVRRELGHPLYGLVPAALFGISSTYYQAVKWFASSFAMPSLVFLLLGLLAVQSWRRTGRGWYLDLAALCCLIAPAWFGSGILAGPVCCLYLAWPQPADQPAPPGRLGHWSVVPLLGTGAFLALSLPLTAQAIMHLPHYHGKTALELFDPWQGLLLTGRSTADNLFLGLFGVSGVHVPLWLVPPLLAGLAALGGWWCRGGSPRLALLGVGLIVSNYWLIYSIRWSWGYEAEPDTGWRGMTTYTWSRYHLLSQLGLSLIVAAGLPARAGRWFTLHDGGLTRRQAGWLLCLIGLLFVAQAPRAVFPLEDWKHQEYQRQELREVGEMDERCRRYGISAETARSALKDHPPPFRKGDYADDVDGWDLLRGSDHPRDLSVEEARRLLEQD